MLIFKDTFKALQNKLKVDYLALRTIDLWNEEIDMYRDEMPLLLPAVYIEFLPVTWNTIGNSNIQHGYATIKLHIAQHIIQDTAAIDGTDLPSQPDALARYTLLQHIHETIQDFKMTYFEPLDRIASYLDHNHGGIIVDIIEYRTILKDTLNNTSNQSYGTIIALPDVAVQPNTVPTPVYGNTGGFTIE